MTKKKKNNNNFKRIYWKDNKEKIMELISDLPTKYLIGRINTCKRDYYAYKTLKEHRIVAVNWRGYRFLASQKTLENELWVNKKRWSEFTLLPNGDNPIGKLCNTYYWRPYEREYKEKSISRNGNKKKIKRR